jgi:hypothetical protein
VSEGARPNPSTLLKPYELSSSRSSERSSHAGTWWATSSCAWRRRVGGCETEPFNPIETL